jgi:ketosteroid isomerase-like protein
VARRASSDVGERILAGYTALSEGRIEPVLELLDPDVEIRDRPESPDASVYHGYEGARTAFQASVEYFEDFEMVPEEFFEGDSDVVVVLRMRGLGRESGVPVDERIAHHWSLRDDRPVRLQVYSDPEDALAAAGIKR